ncbi:MAG: hypothetical protein E7645_06820 [Ruminococcaceae bacterium]|nr:hypothetical protein [Oscillospiraceae bacterium]
MNFRSRISRFLYGRYGSDQLYNFLFILQIILLFVGIVFSALGQINDIFSYLSFFLYLTAFALFVWTLFRCLSRNIIKRRQENMAFLRLKSKIFGRRKSTLPIDTATHIFRTCPKCKSTLRLPRKAGKHTVKCPRCQHRFKVKVK